MVYLTGKIIYPKLAVSCLSIFFTFFLIGIWHGNKLNSDLYGIYHRLGLTIYMLYVHILKIKCQNFFKKLWKSLTYRILCIILTFNFVSWRFLLTLDLKKAKAVFNDVLIVTLADINFAKFSGNF
jgi:D-alanyl-lipoteichoic acid acyltransferase DltB (MBOAT superfamily)